MTGSMAVLATAAAFVGTHFVMSHPLRRPLVDALGEKGFQGVYSLVAFATFGAMVWAYRAAEITAPLWAVGDGLWAVSSALMLIASVLLLGSLVRNPALAGAAVDAGTAEARGVFGVTRHPMMWAFAIWGVSHILIYPVAKNIVLSGAMIVLALVGAALQDRKKAALDPQGWPAWEARTSYLPFAAILAGRARFGGFGMHALGGGLVTWLAATWAHIPLAGWPAGIWRWIG
ncbi:NnrU family protein [Sphingomonas prati]|uniref:Putative membrane protein n=1 Tax=Sphingomonas prati TaxID=1843237 RepID=A0A7W9BUR1_9SPHN|nr:NnrU family protein [Sphingomonas prati]MBB5730391.1 putative membrane protein [Sphingomonas prati]GGE93729.1 denitrification regulatory protein [Sphingomonas prati]